MLAGLRPICQMSYHARVTTAVQVYVDGEWQDFPMVGRLLVAVNGPGIRRRLRRSKQGLMSVGIPPEQASPGAEYVYAYRTEQPRGWLLALEPLPGTETREGW